MFYHTSHGNEIADELTRGEGWGWGGVLFTILLDWSQYWGSWRRI